MTTSVSLRNLIDSARRLDELDAARVIANAAEVVHKLQKGQALHTITPEAIVVAADGSAALQPERGLPAYTSPERLRGEAGDRRSDVFTLGAILWEALTHEPHFEGEIDGEIKAAILEGDYRSATELNANVPAELDAICKKALARTPADRYPSCKVMAAEIATVLDDAGYPDDNTAVAEHLASKYVAPAPKLAKMPTSRDTPMPGTPIVDLAKASPTQTLQGVAPRKELEAALARQQAAEAASEQQAPVAASAPSHQPVAASAPSQQPVAASAPAIPTTPPVPGAAPKSFSKTAILGSLSSADLALPPVEDAPIASAAPAVAAGRKTDVHGSAPSLADRLAAINQGTDAAKPGGVVMLGLPAVPPGADPSSFKTPLPGTLQPPTTLPPPSNITTAETVAVPALAPTLIPQAPVLPADSKPPAPMAAATGVAVSPTDSQPPADPAAVVALPHPRAHSESGPNRAAGEKRDPLAGWGWGTGPHETIAADDDDFYETDRSTKKRLVYAIGGAAAAVLLIVITAFAFGGEKAAKQPEAAAKQTEPAVDWSQPTDPPPAPPIDPAPGAATPSAGSAVDPDASAAGVDPNAGSAALAGSNTGPAPASIDPATAAPTQPEAIAQPEPPAKPEPVTPEPVAKPEPVKPAPVAKPEPVKPAPVAKPEPKKKAEPKAIAKVEPKKLVEPKPKKLPPPQPVAKTRSSSWDPLAPKPDKKPSGPIDPYAEVPPKKAGGDPNAAYKTGIQQFARGDANGALATFKASLAANPDFAPTWRGIGMVYEKLGRRGQAKTAFKRYLQLSPAAGDAGSIRERMERL